MARVQASGWGFGVVWGWVSRGSGFGGFSGSFWWKSCVHPISEACLKAGEGW